MADLQIHDVIVIGAGPCGLAVAARLWENTPSSLFTESEHQRYHWMKAAAASKVSSRLVRTSRRSNTALDRLLSGPGLLNMLDVVVLDSTSNKFMGAWNKRFNILRISHLRSPMFFHPDPRDRDGLLEFAYNQGREKELVEIKGVIGKSLSKHQRKQKTKTSHKAQETTYLDERDRKDYFRPSQPLFDDACTNITCRYNIQDIVQNSAVNLISYDPAQSIFTLKTSTGIKRAKTVVFAAGPGIPPTLPTSCHGFFHKNPQGISHAFSSHESPGCCLPQQVLDKIKLGRSVGIAVVGGGLSSAQVSCAAVEMGVSKVHHLMRRTMKVKHFDVDLSWVGKYKNFAQASFWSADTDEERFEMVRDAKGGGSLTPEYKRLLFDLIKSTNVTLHENAEIIDATWDSNTTTWTLVTFPSIPGLEVDHIVYATGALADFTSLPALKPLHDLAPIKSIGGLPCCTNNLQWNEEIPFFFTGRFASLRLGPAGPNLEGARTGAERIAGRLSEIFDEDQRAKRRDSGYGSEDVQHGGVDMRRLGLGSGNQFDVLGDESDFDTVFEGLKAGFYTAITYLLQMVILLWSHKQGFGRFYSAGMKFTE